MIPKTKTRLLLWLVGLLLAKAPLLHAQAFDLKLGYSLIKITAAKVGGQVKTPTFYRHYGEIELGFGQATLGLVYQNARKDDKTAAGRPEDGVMLTAGYDLILSNHLRLQTYGRLGVSSGNDPAQPLHATETDLRFNLVAFHPEGILMIHHRSLFPSSYVGVIVNKYGRVQSIIGLGAWWNHLGIYLTGFHAFNGVNDPFDPGTSADRAFANLRNRGASIELSYEFRDIRLGLKRTHAIKNGGNDLMLSLQYRHFFEGHGK